ncbi:hypothetical protein IJ596_01265, partial [bacterium]|nr:hypothetical protein [bacterium]
IKYVLRETNFLKSMYCDDIISLTPGQRLQAIEDAKEAFSKPWSESSVYNVIARKKNVKGETIAAKMRLKKEATKMPLHKLLKEVIADTLRTSWQISSSRLKSLLR